MKGRVNHLSEAPAEDRKPGARRRPRKLAVEEKSKQDKSGQDQGRMPGGRVNHKHGQEKHDGREKDRQKQGRTLVHDSSPEKARPILPSQGSKKQ